MRVSGVWLLAQGLRWMTSSGMAGATDFHSSYPQGYEPQHLAGGLPREQKMLKEHLPRVVYHFVYNVYYGYGSRPSASLEATPLMLISARLGFRAKNFGLGGQGWGVSLVLRFCAGPADLGDFCGRIVVYGVGRRFYGWEVCVWGFVSGGWGLVSGV